MKERPILFNDSMVRAVLAGKKSQTRRLLKSPYSADGPFTWVSGHEGFSGCLDLSCNGYDENGEQQIFPCPFGSVGDRLWVRETFFKYYPKEGWPKPKALYRADGITLIEEDGMPQRWSPSIHMPRSLSWITLEITEIRVERLQDMTNEDALAEGIEAVREHFHETGSVNRANWYVLGLDVPQCAYACLWDTLYGAHPWASNPWVWVIGFQRVDGGIQ